MTLATQHEKRARWLALWRRLDGVRFNPLPGEAELARARAGLPQRRLGESLPEWLGRATPSAATAPPRRGVVLPFPSVRLRRLAEISLKAAADTLYALPEHPVETTDPAFRLGVAKVEDGLRVYLEALGETIDRYAGQHVGIAASEADPGSLVVALQLDGDGEGVAVVDDDEAVRRVLCVRPVIVLIESGDA